MSCTAEQIAEKKRLALERLKQKTNALPNPSNHPNQQISTETVIQPSTPSINSTTSFYGANINSKTNELTNYENKIKTQKMFKNNNRILSQPYPKKEPSSSLGQPGMGSISAAINAASNAAIDKTNTTNKVASVFVKTITCTCEVIEPNRFQVVMSGYNENLIKVFKTIPSRKYDINTKIWSFDLKDYELVRESVSGLNPNVVIGAIPKFVLKLLSTPATEPDSTCLYAIEPKLVGELLPFQKEGVCFGIEKQGRCMIADDMGLGKTYQALAIADFYKDDWPLLICTTAATRNVWAEKVRILLPWVPCQYIVCLTSTQDYFGDAKVLIVSYSLMERNFDRLAEKRFGFVIFDESHLLKNFKTKSSAVALKLSQKAKRVVLLTGTPALSRPSELFTQLQMMDPKFFTYKEYSIRYCAGKQSTFGWDASGQSNLHELNIVLSRKFMIRRTKEDVQFELGEKSRETILLDLNLVWSGKDDEMRETVENLKEYSSDFMKLKGKQREEVLLKYYNETARIKAKAVCNYIGNLLKDKIKFIVFGHHQYMLNAISECLNKKNVEFIRIDGATKNEVRATYIKRFQEQESCRVAVLSLKACNAGITLTAAKLVLFAELDWNPSTLAQAEARAHRIGQTDNVICRYLLAKGTADDVIWEMLKNKQNVLNKAGLFSEDLSDATHSAAPVSGLNTSNTLEHYFEVTPKKDQNPSTSTKTPNTTPNEKAKCTKQLTLNMQPDKLNNYHNMLDDENDDALLGSTNIKLNFTPTKNTECDKKVELNKENDNNTCDKSNDYHSMLDDDIDEALLELDF